MDHSNSGVAEVSAVSSSAPAAESSSSGVAVANYDAETTISSLEELREKAPKVYQAILEGLAMNLINDMKDHEDKMKQLHREAQREAAG